MPFAQFDFSAPWSLRVDPTDAAPGGHSIAFTHVDQGIVERWVCFASLRGDRTHLVHSDLLPEHDGTCHLVKAKLPFHHYYLHCVHRLGGFDYISIEEFHVANRNQELGLRSLVLFNARYLLIGDNTTHLGVHVRGRSSSHRIHVCCRTSMAICAAG